MDFCSLDDIKDTPLTYNNNNNNLLYLEDGRTFTTYRSHTEILELIAKKYNLELYSNSFRSFIQNNPEKIKNIYQTFLKKSD